MGHIAINQYQRRYDMNVHYSTTNGERTGRASPFYSDIKDAGLKAASQSVKASGMGIKSRYEVASCDESELSQGEKVRR